jgi:hypothetical protein
MTLAELGLTATGLLEKVKERVLFTPLTGLGSLLEGFWWLF